MFSARIIIYISVLRWIKLFEIYCHPCCWLVRLFVCCYVPLIYERRIEQFRIGRCVWIAWQNMACLPPSANGGRGISKGKNNIDRRSKTQAARNPIDHHSLSLNLSGSFPLRSSIAYYSQPMLNVIAAHLALMMLWIFWFCTNFRRLPHRNPVWVKNTQTHGSFDYLKSTLISLHRNRT